MTSIQKPSGDHTQFDAICAAVGEWDALPTIVTADPGPDGPVAVEDDHDDDRDTELDGLIFAGLVTPY